MSCSSILWYSRCVSKLLRLRKGGMTKRSSPETVDLTKQAPALRCPAWSAVDEVEVYRRFGGCLPAAVSLPQDQGQIGGVTQRTKPCIMIQTVRLRYAIRHDTLVQPG